MPGAILYNKVYFNEQLYLVYFRLFSKEKGHSLTKVTFLIYCSSQQLGRLLLNQLNQGLKTEILPSMPLPTLERMPELPWRQRVCVAPQSFVAGTRSFL